MDLDELERLAQAATPGPWRGDYKYGIITAYQPTQEVVSWDYAWGDVANEYDDKPYIAAASPDAVLALIARVRAAEAERDRLRALFDDAGQGEHDVLALVDHYQDVARKERADRWEAYPRALQAAADVVYQALTCDMPVGIAAAILALSADEIDAFAEQQEQAHGAESGER